MRHEHSLTRKAPKMYTIETDVKVNAIEHTVTCLVEWNSEGKGRVLTILWNGTRTDFQMLADHLNDIVDGRNDPSHFLFIK